MLIVERWLLERLRHKTFYSLAEVNASLGELLGQLNEERPIRRLASALGNKACRDNRSVIISYQRVPWPFEELALARGDGRIRT